MKYLNSTSNLITNHNYTINICSQLMFLEKQNYILVNKKDYPCEENWNITNFIQCFREDLIKQNEHSCLETDIEHQEEVNKQKASPAVFVYTLPNIVIGEISIRNKWFGESAFFLMKIWHF